MQEFEFHSPRTLDELLQTLADPGGRLIAGGTDVVPHMRDGRFQAGRLVDLGRQEGLRFIEAHDGTVRIGSLTTYAHMIDSPLLRAEATALVQAAAAVGSIQTRQRGTLGGNIGNASPAGDTLPPLLVLDADVVLVSLDGKRTLRLADLLHGPGRTALGPHEVIHHVSFRRLPEQARSIFVRLGNRRGMAVSIASVALVLNMDQADVVQDVRIALGAVAPTAMRCPLAEGILKSKPFSEALIKKAAHMAAGECSPIDDVRGTADYRRRAVRYLVARGLWAAAEKPRAGF